MSCEFKYNIDALNKFAKGLSEKHFVSVGIMGTKNTRFEAGDLKKGGGHKVTKSKSDMSNADIGALHELGSLSKGIPVRSWLVVPLVDNAKEIIAEIIAKGAYEAIGKGKVSLVFKNLGFACEAMIQKAFATGGFGKWQANIASTIAAKGSASPLIDTGQLRRSVSSKVD